MSSVPAPAPADPVQAVQRIRELARAHGFQRCGIAGIELGEDEAHLADWLGQGLYGTMDWMARHGTLRARPAELLPGTVRVISVGMDYSHLTALTVEGIKEQQTEIAAQTQRIANLEAENADLKARLERLEALVAGPNAEGTWQGRAE